MFFFTRLSTILIQHFELFAFADNSQVSKQVVDLFIQQEIDVESFNNTQIDTKMLYSVFNHITTAEKYFILKLELIIMGLVALIAFL